ncbi:MAG: amidohydrolase [Candidatus Heimdallarchaeota archaeon]|nr:MAG: amidohydrolase [Candidatus Heimdallarchaeota archaeon]
MLSDIIIKNTRAIIPMRGDITEPRILRNQSILISGSQIAEIGENISVPQGTEKIDANGKVIIPGLVNSHTHLAMNLLKGFADDIKLQEWLEEKIWPFESKMTPEDIEFGARLGALEAVSSGTTTLNTMYHHSDREAKALADIGLRAVIGHVCFSWRKDDDYRATQQVINEFHGSYNDRIRCSIDPHTAYTVDYDFLRQLIDLKHEYQEKFENAPFIHTHAAETKYETQQIRDFLKDQNYKSHIDSSIQYLHDCGILREACVAHGVWLSEKDIQIIKEDDARIASCPISNLKLSSGIAPVDKLVKTGVTVGFGTDGCSSNNVLDMFETTKIGSLLQKVHAGFNSQAVPAYQALWLSTRGSAKTIHWDDSIGALEIGNKADIILVDFKAPHLIPTWDEISHLVYATKGSDVSDVIIDGELVYQNKKFVNIDFEQFYDEANEYIQKLDDRVNN